MRGSPCFSVDFHSTPYVGTTSSGPREGSFEVGLRGCTASSERRDPATKAHSIYHELVNLPHESCRGLDSQKCCRARTARVVASPTPRSE